MVRATQKNLSNVASRGKFCLDERCKQRVPSHGFTLNCLNTVSLSGCQSMCSKPTQRERKRGSVQTYSKPAVFCGVAEEPGRPGPSSVPRKLAATTCLCLFVPHPAGGALACPGCFIQSACPHSGPSSAVAYFWRRFSFKICRCSTHKQFSCCYYLPHVRGGTWS